MGGYISYLKWDEWEEFISRYLTGENSSSADNNIELVIEELLIEELLVQGQKFTDITMDIKKQGVSTYLKLSSNWLEGTVETNDKDKLWHVDISQLDIKGLIETSKLVRIDSKNTF